MSKQAVKCLGLVDHQADLNSFKMAREIPQDFAVYDDLPWDYKVVEAWHGDPIADNAYSCQQQQGM